MTFRELLAAEFSPYGALSEEVLAGCERHYEVLKRWNARMNLTRIESLEEVVRLHYAESLFLGKWLPDGIRSVVDVGSGPGFPGVPVAILRPEIDVTLVESHHRKAVFLREATRGMENIQVIAKRAQEVAGSFDWTISRAVSVPEVAGLHLSRNWAVLCSATDVPKGWDSIALPWGSSRVLACFT